MAENGLDDAEMVEDGLDKVVGGKDDLVDTELVMDSLNEVVGGRMTLTMPYWLRAALMMTQ